LHGAGGDLIRVGEDCDDFLQFFEGVRQQFSLWPRLRIFSANAQDFRRSATAAVLIVPTAAIFKATTVGILS
jgi:hypothetical protein